MFNSLNHSPSWDLAPKSRLRAFVDQGPVTTRVAPSPTGHVHLGTLRTALHNYLLAKASGGNFVLRIDDTDAARNNPDHVALIHHTLAVCGLTYDQTFHQSDRRTQHLQAAQLLLDNGWAYRDGSAIRLSPKACNLTPPQFFDLAAGVCPISATFLNQTSDLVLVRSDGQPTYHFASIVDDIDTNISLIARGTDHLANTTKQITIAQALAHSNHPQAQNFINTIVFAHIGLIMHNGKKMSKRDAASNIAQYLDDGICPQALLQWAMPLGWGHPDGQLDKHTPLIGLDNMPLIFAQGGLRATNCNINPQRLTDLQKKWARALA